MKSRTAKRALPLAGVMWNWRMLLATREARFADEMERALFNGFLSGVSLDGDRFFYVNPLLSRGVQEVQSRTTAQRLEWWRVACCPPNVMRTLSSLASYFASVDDGGLQIHQYATALITSDAVQLKMATRYPWDGSVSITVEETPAQPWRLALRIPGWTPGATLRVNGESTALSARPGSYAELERAWRSGDKVELELNLRPRLLAAHPWLESSRGCLAIQRGPLIYCLEQIDHGSNHVLDLTIDPRSALESAWRPDMLDGVVTVTTRGYSVDSTQWSDQLYRPLDKVQPPASRPVELVAIPYYAWANRGPGAMRVWIPAVA